MITIDGGAGRDAYDASVTDGLNTVFQINLDTKAHGGIAANSVIVDGRLRPHLQFLVQSSARTVPSFMEQCGQSHCQ
ncbi:MAG: hypothetical protein R3D01_13335 [Hyphomicrobiales bacterium]